MASKAPKKKESRERVASAARTIAEQSMAPSVVGSQNDKDEKNKKNKMPILIWPEWTEQDINQEKWETAHKAKEKEKGKSPNPHPYEDPEGRIDLPAAIKSRVDHWKRPVEFITDKTPVIVEQKSLTEEVDLLSSNDHLTHSETLRCIISQVTCLWKLHFKVEVPEVKTTKDAKEGKGDKDKDKEKDKDKDGQLEDNYWKPWGHIWPKEKTKGSPLPVYNPGGKYCVKLHWLGSWRKVTVDDWMPFDEEGMMLLPASPNEQELWPMLLSKALLKVCSLDYAGGSSSCEFGDFSVVHCLTGWLPEIIPLRNGRTGEIWKLLLQSLPHWKLENTAPPPTEERKQASPEGKRPSDRDKERKSTRSDKGQSHDKFHSDKAGKDKDSKEKAASVVGGVPEQPKEPEVVIFASYSHPPTAPMRISVLREMADASEKLRQSGFSHTHPHPVLVTLIRDCPLVAPPPPVQIPRWKLIRQKKKPQQPVEPAVTPPEPPRDPNFLQVTSPFVNYSVSPVPVSRARTPIRWLKFKPEKPMGEISEEGDKDGDENKANNEKKGEGGEAGEAVDEAAKEVIPKADPEEAKQAAEQDKEKEGRESKDSLLRERSGTKDSSKAAPRVKSGRSDRAAAEKTGDKSAKSSSEKQGRAGAKLNVGDSPVRAKSGGSGRGRRMSRMEKPVTEPRSPDTRRMSRVEKMKLELEREASSKADAIHEEEQVQTLAVPLGSADGEKPAGEGTDGETPQQGGEGEKCEEGDKAAEQQNKEKKLWMEFEDFCKCFGHLYIFHKPNTYQCTKSSIDLKAGFAASPPALFSVPERWVLKASGRHHGGRNTAMGVRSLRRRESDMSMLSNVVTTGHVSKKSGLAPTASVTGTTPAPGKATALSPSPYHSSYGAQAQSQDPPPPYLFVDSLKPIEIVVNFTSFSRWLDPPLPIIREKDKEKEKDSMSTITDMREIPQTEEKQAPPTQGLLVAEPYSWKSLVTGQPVLRIRTTGTKAAVLVLPPGRHVMRFLIQSPHGYNVEMCSQTPFVYGDEDAVMTCLTKESCRFVEHAVKVVQSVGRLVASFADPPPVTEKRIELDLELNDQTKEIQDRHYKVFMKCLLKALKYQLAEAYDADMHFAWKCLSFQAALSLRQPITRRPLSAADISRIGAMKRRSPVKSASAVPPTWVDRAANGEEEMAALKIQASFRGYFVRKLARAYCQNTAEHQQVSELLAKAWSAVEPGLEEFAIETFRRMFKRDAALFPLFPFFTDEWSRVAFTDYNGGFPEQPPHSWFVVFREVFFVDEPVLMVPKLYVNLPTCLMRVVDNDTGEELTRVFQRVAPSNLKKNKRGYTFVGEARTLSAILPPGKFRLRVIGSTEPLPYPAREGVNSHFVTKEIRDYYIPNMYNIIFRYTVRVTEDHMASLQLGTSKTDVYIKLQILDHEQEVTSATGKGHVVIPAFMFFRDRTGDDDDKHSVRGSRPTTSSHPRSGKRPQSGRKAASPIQTRVGKKSAKESNATSRPGSSSVRHKGSRPLLSHDSDDREDEEEVNDFEPEVKVHKYVIQAQVLRDSWPLSKSAWEFIAMLKNLDRLDVEGPVESNPRGEKLSASTSKAKKGKEGKESRSSKGQAGSRPSSQQQFDSSKPNWTLRIVSDASVEEIEVKKDTERQDEIKAMKQAWEAAEPGRAAKARQSRQKFLNEHLVKVEKDAIEEENGDEESEEKEAPSEIFTVTSPIQSDAEQGELTLTPPPKEPDQVLQPPEPPKYISSRGGNPVLLDAAEEERRRPERQEKFRAFKMKKEEMEKLRELDRQERNAAKERQLQIAEQLQAALDKARQGVGVPREAYRQKFLEAEKQEEQAAEAAKEKERSPSPGKSRKSASTAKGGRKTPSKGKKK